MLGLIFVNKIGNTFDGIKLYEFYFSSFSETAWGVDWDVKPAGICNLSTPVQTEFEKIEILKSEVDLSLAQKNSCFSLQDCKDGIIPCAWENLDNAEEYPENGRLVFPFGTDIETIKMMLAKRNIIFEITA